MDNKDEVIKILVQQNKFLLESVNSLTRILLDKEGKLDLSWSDKAKIFAVMRKTYDCIKVYDDADPVKGKSPNSLTPYLE